MPVKGRSLTKGIASVLIAALKELLKVPPEEVSPIVRNTLKHTSDLRVKLEEEIFDKILAVGLIVAPRTIDPDEDLDLPRYAGARYVASNKAQKGRDLAEHGREHACPEEGSRGSHSLTSTIVLVASMKHF
jgi:hypothetical protein